MTNSRYDLSALHNRDYFASFTPPYSTLHVVWNDHFGRAAAQVIDQLQPESVIDAGCALGVLVRQFLARGVPATGFDFSPGAIEDAVAADPALNGLLSVHDLTNPFDGEADAVICIEVVEHIPEANAGAAIANLCQMARRFVVFSSTSVDNEPMLHVNVQPAAYWDALFEANGFRRTNKNVTNFCAWAVAYERVAPRMEQVEDVMDEPVYEEAPANVETQEFEALQEIKPGEDVTEAALAEAPKPKTRRKAAKG